MFAAWRPRARLGKADAFAHWRAVNHRGFVRLPDEHLGLPAQRSMFSMHNVRLLLRLGTMTTETIRRRVVFTVDMSPNSARSGSREAIIIFL